MLEEFSAQIKIFVGLIGAFIVAVIGVMARQAQIVGKLSPRLVLLDTPFAMLCAIFAGGLGELLDVPAIVTYAVAGAIAYLGGEWFRLTLGAIIKKKAGLDDVPKADTQDAPAPPKDS